MWRTAGPPASHGALAASFASSCRACCIPRVAVTPVRRLGVAAVCLLVAHAARRHCAPKQLPELSQDLKRLSLLFLLQFEVFQKSYSKAFCLDTVVAVMKVGNCSGDGHVDQHHVSGQVSLNDMASIELPSRSVVTILRWHTATYTTQCWPPLCGRRSSRTLIAVLGKDTNRVSAFQLPTDSEQINRVYIEV